ncbi:MAG: type II secretion system protein [Lachnospiraceae bacterium]
MQDLDRQRKWHDKFHINNSGYSLVELIIVIAIMAVLIGTVFYSITMIFGANAKTCANNIQRAIADCKVTTMGKKEAYMELYRAADGNVYTKLYVYEQTGATPVEGEPQKMGNSRVYVGYIKPGETPDAATELNSGDSVTIKFDRSSGSFDKTAHDNCAQIIVRGGSKNYAIEMTQLTGKSEVKAIAPLP